MIRGYRVWDNQEKTYSDKAFSIDQLGICYVQDEDGYWEEIDDSRFIVEFETGLTDKNGKELYEGDTLGGVFEGCYIGWCDTTKSFELFNCYEHYCMACDGDILWCELSDSDIDLVIIGNIHENPELLGGGQ